MRISVVISCRNAETAIAATLRTTLAQSAAPAEVIVVDDCSSDRTRSIVARFLGPVRVLRGEDRGPSRARGLGVQAASGEALCFLDAGDLLAPDALHELSRALTERDAEIAVCRWVRGRRENGVWSSFAVPDEPGVFSDGVSAWLSGWRPPLCSLLWSRAAIDRLKSESDDDLSEEGDTLLHALLEGAKLARTRRTIAYRGRGAPPAHGADDRSRLEAKLRAAQRLARTLEARGRGHAPALARAYERLGENARRYPDLHRHCRNEARRLGGSPASRAAHRLAHESGQRAGSAVAVMRAMADRRSLLELANRSPSQGSRAEIELRRPRLGVSVIVPAIGEAGALRRAVESVVAQTYAGWEILIIDDGISEEPARLAASFGADKRVRHLRVTPQRRFADACNLGIAEARGAYLALLRPGAVWAPTKLQRQVETFERGPIALGLVHTGGVGRPRSTFRATAGYLYPRLLDGAMLDIEPSSLMARREVHETVGGFDGAMEGLEVEEFFLRASRLFLVDFIRDPLVALRGAGPAAEAPKAALGDLYARYCSEIRAVGAEPAFLARMRLGRPRASAAPAAQPIQAAAPSEPPRAAALSFLRRGPGPSTRAAIARLIRFPALFRPATRTA